MVYNEFLIVAAVGDMKTLITSFSDRMLVMALDENQTSGFPSPMVAILFTFIEPLLL